MTDIEIRKTGRTGRITFNRPKALNALSYKMCLALEDALDAWSGDDDVAMIVIDAAGDKAFCAGGDIAELYETGTKGDFAFGRRFWADEYRMNAKLFEFPKPVASFMQGFTMGGGVGVGCHGAHRVVGATSRIAMPECGIGLVPDVGGSLILARAPGRLGEYLGLTAARMEPGDAILAGFADHYIPEDDWPALIARLEDTADPALIEQAAHPAPPSALTAQRDAIDAAFSGAGLADIVAALRADDSDFGAAALKSLSRNSPLSLGCALEIIRHSRKADDIRAALDMEYRFTYRAMEKGDLLEGIRAAIIDKDRNPDWQHGLESLPDTAVSDMLKPLEGAALTFEKGE
ncbi:Enoyl-CoA hydratase/carnithine racemase [Salinihabitans flavidus]|uniref:3-hydroxyisobutyryl-CoA hydrolase n=1 Tax=Salinihabitans flavidus TaxID=569882 RepID=A0A1H8QDH9_9RHOB|nr:enoyl-CoA hydratase/isomerase family protein [Salinihabitans flavidus]SEO51823.1 Enoyl-CoA hydratase/carnithine racemase [Salinihabitans flavidus]